MMYSEREILTWLVNSRIILKSTNYFFKYLKLIERLFDEPLSHQDLSSRNFPPRKAILRNVQTSVTQDGARQPAGDFNRQWNFGRRWEYGLRKTPKNNLDGVVFGKSFK